ncbi:MAG TPA: TIGR00725 family protein [Polyangia bacterium]|nr:TIGR00725 family protein [Polyangia bacterium]
MPARARTYRTVIGVMGPAACDSATADVARAVGRAIAERGAVLLCGGRGGVMEAAAEGARGAGGLTIGILPGEDARASPPNAFVDVALFTGLGEGRNWLNVCASDAIIAIGGGFGTLSEIALALKAKRPLVLFGSWTFDMDGAAPQVPRAAHATEAVELALEAIEAAAAAASAR